jgi:hypothetical protein
MRLVGQRLPVVQPLFGHRATGPDQPGGMVSRGFLWHRVDLALEKAPRGRTTKDLRVVVASPLRVLIG